MEGDGGEDERDDHSRGGEDHHASATNRVDHPEGEAGEEEVDGGDDETSGGRVVEADGLEEGGGLKGTKRGKKGSGRSRVAAVELESAAHSRSTLECC